MPGLHKKPQSSGLLNSAPLLTEAEVLTAYHALRSKHGIVSVDLHKFEAWIVNCLACECGSMTHNGVA